MRLAWLVAFVATVTINWLSGSVASAGAGTLDPAALRHEIKLTYCVEQRSKRFYRTENLEDLCTLKVAFFDDLVSIMNKVIIDFLKVQLFAVLNWWLSTSSLSASLSLVWRKETPRIAQNVSKIEKLEMSC